MKNLFSFIFAISSIVLSIFPLMILPEEGSYLFFFVGILVAVLGIRVANWIVKKMAKNPKVIFTLFSISLIAYAVYLFFEFDIIDNLNVFDGSMGWISGLVIGAGIQVIHCYLFLTDRV